MMKSRSHNNRVLFVSMFCTLALILTIFAPQCSFAATSKEKKVTVNVESDGTCQFSVSISDQSWGGIQLCAPDYPTGAAEKLRQYIGQRIEVKAKFTYLDGAKKAPNGIVKLIQIAGDKIYDPCAVSTMLVIASALNHAPMPPPPPGCGVSADTTPLPGSDVPQASQPDASNSQAESPAGVYSPLPSPQGVPAASSGQGSHYVAGVPQCGHSQYVTTPVESFYLVNSCNIKVGITVTSDGALWGADSLGPGQRHLFETMGLASPKKSGTISLYTCPGDSTPVTTNGTPVSRSYHGPYRCQLP